MDCAMMISKETDNAKSSCDCASRDATSSVSKNPTPKCRFPAVETDRGIVQLPWRVQVLAKYGEGPHNTALALMPLVLLALWVAARRRGYPPVLGAAILLAATPLVN